MNLDLDKLEETAKAGLAAETYTEAKAAGDRLTALFDEATFQDALLIVELLRGARRGHQ